MKKTLFLIVLVLSVITVQSCDWWLDIPEEEEPDTKMTIGAYILNSGDYGSNNTLLSIYSTIGNTVMDSCFIQVNGKQLGDYGQDMEVFGEKLYVSMYGSGKITVIDKFSCKFLSDIEVASPVTGDKLSPRSIVGYGGYLYASYYEGYVGKIDTATFSVQLAKVGDNPEDIVVASEKLYVANSGGMNYPDYGNTVSVLNLSDLSLIKNIEVVQNPCYMDVDSEGDIYLVSNGNYADVPSCLQRITTVNDIATPIPEVKNPFLVAATAGNQMVIVTSYFDEDWKAHYGVINYNTSASVEAVAGSFISDGSTLGNIYSLSIDKYTGACYFGISDYVTNGDIYVYHPTGEYITKFFSGGLNPAKVAFVRNY